jgi:hypothetical protein
MFASLPDLSTVAVLVVGALFAGFAVGFAGFGTGLVASGIWLYAVPPAAVPPLVVLSSVAGQLVGLVTVRRAFDWTQTLPYLVGGVIGVPLGVAALAAASPFVIKAAVGGFLIAYSLYQLFHRANYEIGRWGGRIADTIVGVGGGLLGGFAGLSGPLPLIWLQLRGGPIDNQRAAYQPFNLIVLAFTAVVMAIDGQMTPEVLTVSLVSLPATLIGAAIGARVYVGVSVRSFQRVVLCLLLISGCVLIGSTFSR